MHTPEPRRVRNSGGDAEGTTPRVESNSVTPTPRAGFLRRGDTASSGTLHGAIAAGPSVLFDEESGTAVALDVSPQPSQLSQQLHPAYPAGAQPRLPRQRPRFHTVQDLDVALHQAIEGKINSRNAWASKEASDLLEGITHTIETTLDAASADDYSGFAKAATVVEGCSKVWTSRVDSTYQQSNQMVQRLLRKDETSGKGPEEGEDGAEDGDEDAPQSQRNKSRSRSAAATAAAAAAGATRTLALDATEINLDSKSRTALTQTGVNAQFRAITSKFDQGNAQGLLMNNAPIGRAGNIILDVDYSLMPAAVMAAGRVSGGRGSNSRRNAQTAGANTAAVTTVVGEGDAEADPKAAASRTSQHAAVEHDGAVYESVLDFPPYAGVNVAAGSDSAGGAVSSPSQPASARASLAFSQRGSSGGLQADTRASQASQLDPLLVLPHTSSSSPPTADFEEGWLGGEGGAAPAAAAKPAVDSDDDDDNNNDYGSWGGDGGEDETADNSLAVTTATSGSARDLGLEARHLVSGVTEMEAMDTLFHGHTQLALEAEDPTSWCPLSEVAKNPLADGLGRSELSRLHREHRFTQSQKSSGGAVVGGPASALDGGPSSPVTKRGRREKTVAFQLPDAAGRSGASSGSESLVLLTGAASDPQGDAALRQATTAARNITPLGKQLLLAKDAAHAVVAFTQSTVQRSKAEQAGLVLAEPPEPGKTIPSYMPYPVHTQDYFQPFSTSLTQWNLLRKSATGRLIDSSGGATATTGNENNSVAGGGEGKSSGHRLGHYGANDDDDDRDGGFREADMPVEFFPGGAEVEGDDGAAAGGDYDDYADLYGPDDAGSDEADEEGRYVREGFRNSAEARLLAQVDLAATAAVVAASARSSSGSAARSSGGESGALADPLALLQVLSSPEATIPNQVDVVRLRQLMWDALQGHLAANQQEKAGDLTDLRSGGGGAAGEAAGTSDAQSGQRLNAPATTKTAVKAHAQAVLDRIRKRARAAEAESSEDDAEESEKEGGGGAQHAAKRRVDDRQPPTTAATAEVASSKVTVPPRVALTRFTDVVRSVLPHIGSVSSTNTLSPAFFFFSILFLANEHNVVLQNVESLDDLRACGIARRVGEKA